MPSCASEILCEFLNQSTKVVLDFIFGLIDAIKTFLRENKKGTPKKSWNKNWKGVQDVTMKLKIDPNILAKYVFLPGPKFFGGLSTSAQGATREAPQRVQPTRRRHPRFKSQKGRSWSVSISPSRWPPSAAAPHPDLVAFEEATQEQLQDFLVDFKDDRRFPDEDLTSGSGWPRPIAAPPGWSGPPRRARWNRRGRSHWLGSTYLRLPSRSPSRTQGSRLWKTTTVHRVPSLLPSEARSQWTFTTLNLVPSLSLI